MKFLDLVPSWVYAAAIAVLTLALGVNTVRMYRAKAELAQYRAEVADNTRKAEAEARAKEQSMRKQADRIIHEQTKKQTELAARAADTSAALDSLRNENERLNARPAPTDPGAAAIAREARTARELLGACAERYTAVARDVEGLVDQVSGLQDFARNVCK